MKKNSVINGKDSDLFKDNYICNRNMLTFEELKELSNLEKLLSEVDQEMHNLAISKSLRYAEFFKIILCKIYDELKGKRNGVIQLQIYPNESFSSAYDRILSLYSETKEYYARYSPVELDKEIKLSKEALLHLVQIVQEFSLLKTKHSILQDFFMKFGPSILKKDLDQFFTPAEIVDFLVDILQITNDTYAIDPAGGSGDFLTGILKKGINIKDIGERIFYWDNSQEAASVAALNMILHGDGRANITVKDSIEDFESSNGKFSICITNPPFGNKTVWSKSKDINVMNNYELGHKWKKNTKIEALINQQLGILFIERGFKLLKENGILAIVLPNGYLTNPSESYIRKWLFQNGRIIGIISLPAGTFKKSGTGVTPVILLFQKTLSQGDYKIFTAVANKIGFDYTDQRTPKIFKRDPRDGSFILDEKDNRIPDNDLQEIAKKIKKFAHDNKLSNFEEMNFDIEYEYITKKEVLEDRELVICPKREQKDIKDIINIIKKGGYTTLHEMGAEVQNSDSVLIDKSNKYIYLDIGEIGTGSYLKNNEVFGWDLPGRARQSVKRYDILASKLKGSSNKFCMVLEENPNLVVTNGVYRIRINDEKERLNFYHFMHTKEYILQVEALATGSIMEDVKVGDFLNKIFIPTKDKEKNYLKMKTLIEVQEQLYNLWK